MIQFTPSCCSVKHDGNVLLTTLADANVVHGAVGAPALTWRGLDNQATLQPRVAGPAHGLPLPSRVFY
jgi:hypothetical protein